MIMNNSFSIFVEDLNTHKETIINLGKECKKLGDTVLFTDSIDSASFTDYAIFSSFYMRFFKGIVIFLTVEDHTQYKNTIIGKPMLYLTPDMLKSNNIDMSLVDKNNIFSVSGGYS